MIETVLYGHTPAGEGRGTLRGSSNNTANNYKNNKVFFNAAPRKSREGVFAPFELCGAEEKQGASHQYSRYQDYRQGKRG